MKFGYQILLAGAAIMFSSIAMSQTINLSDGDKPIKQKIVSKRFESKHAKPMKKLLRLEMKDEKLRKMD
jgi:hypothetical protein